MHLRKRQKKNDPHQEFWSFLILKCEFKFDDEITKRYQSENRKDLIVRPIGMGTCLVFGVNPNILGSAKYFIKIIGGENAQAFESDDRAFLRLGDSKNIRYFSREILEEIATRKDIMASPVIQS